jgi:hypothetical protein
VVSALTVAVVAQGQTVTVAIPASQRRHAALIYDPSKWTSDGLTRLQDGDPAVTFQACKAGASPYGAAETQFNGGFLVVAPAAWTWRCGSAMPANRRRSGSPSVRVAAASR